MISCSNTSKFLEDILLELFVHLEKMHKPKSILWWWVAMNVKANLYLSKNLKKKIFLRTLSPADETNVFEIII